MSAAAGLAAATDADVVQAAVEASVQALDAVIKAIASGAAPRTATPPRYNRELLARPPFRFLHDLITAVLSLRPEVDVIWTDDERDAVTLRDTGGRQAKVDYFNKVFRLIELARGEAGVADAGKILAGKEPDRTNRMIVLLCELALARDVDLMPCVEAMCKGSGIAVVNRLVLPEPPTEPPPSTATRRPTTPERGVYAPATVATLPYEGGSGASARSPQRPGSARRLALEAQRRPATAGPRLMAADDTGSVQVNDRAMLAALLGIAAAPAAAVEASAPMRSPDIMSWESMRPSTAAASGRPSTGYMRGAEALSSVGSRAFVPSSRSSYGGVNAVTLMHDIAQADPLLSILSGGPKQSPTTLLVAAETGDLKTVREWLANYEGKDIDSFRGLNNYTALHHAATRGHAKIVQALLEAGAHVEAMTDSRETCLHFAAYNGHLIVTELLIDHAPESIDVQNQYGETPLFYAVRKAHISIVRLLLQRSANPNIVNRFGEGPQAESSDKAVLSTFMTAHALRPQLFWRLSYTICGTILEFLRISDLGKLACVSARWRRIFEYEGKELFQARGVRRWEMSMTATTGFAAPAAMAFMRPPSFRSSSGSASGARRASGSGSSRGIALNNERRS